MLLAAIWSLFFQPLLLAGHLSRCDTTTDCGGSCHRDDPLAVEGRAAHRAALPVDDASRDDDAAAASGHNGVHCVFCRVLLLAGKGLAAAVAIDLSGTPLVARALPTDDLEGVADRGHAAQAPRAPPSC